MPSKEKKERETDMGKGTDLWDDSALIDAFDHAMATYKAMHSKEYQGNFLEEGKQTIESNKDEPVHAEKTMEQIEPDDDINNLNDGAAEIHVTEDLPDQKDNQSTKFNELLRQYYELEEKKQKIVEQLGDTNYLNQMTVQSCTSQMHDVPSSNACNASEYGQQHPCSLCSCHYLAVPVSTCAIGGLSPGGYSCCPPWIASCSKFPANLFPGAECPAQSGTCSVGASYSMDPVKAGMIAAERAISSMKTEISATANICEGKEMGNDKPENSGLQECKGSESIRPETDLAVVLNAWYSAGFHTGRYLLEQSRGNSHQ